MNITYRVTNSFKYRAISLKSNVWVVSSPPPHDYLDDPEPFRCHGSGLLLSVDTVFDAGVDTAEVS